MKWVECEKVDYINNVWSPMVKLLIKFANSPLRQIEIVEWQSEYRSYEAARTAARRALKTEHLADRNLRVISVRDKLYVVKEEENE